jgi:hypothetical protein
MYPAGKTCPQSPQAMVPEGERTRLPGDHTGIFMIISGGLSEPTSSMPTQTESVQPE